MTEQEKLIEDLKNALGNYNDGFWSKNDVISEIENISEKLISEIESE